MTVGELERGRGTPMSSAEFQEWRVYYQIKKSEHDAAHPEQGSMG